MPVVVPALSRGGVVLSLAWDSTIASCGVAGLGSSYTTATSLGGGPGCFATSVVGLDTVNIVSPVHSPGARVMPSPVVASRQSARLYRSQTLPDGRVPMVPEMAAMRAAARDLTPGTTPPPPSGPSVPSYSGSRFVVLDSVPLAHLGDVAPT